jgi:hypothetical protein
MTDSILTKCKRAIGFIALVAAFYVTWNMAPAAKQAIKFIWEGLV